jgi:hypothetical protein
MSLFRSKLIYTYIHRPNPAYIKGERTRKHSTSSDNSPSTNPHDHQIMIQLRQVLNIYFLSYLLSFLVLFVSSAPLSAEIACIHIPPWHPPCGGVGKPNCIKKRTLTLCGGECCGGVCKSTTTNGFFGGDTCVYETTEQCESIGGVGVCSGTTCASGETCTNGCCFK